MKNTEFRGPLIAGTLLAVASSGLRAAQAVAVGLLIAAVASAPGNSTAGFLIVAVVAAVLLRSGLAFVAAALSARSIATLTTVWRQRIFRGLVADGPLAVAGARSGTLQSTLGEGVESAASYQLRYKPVLINSVVAPLGMVILLAVVAWPAAIAALTGAVLMLVVPAFWHKARAASSEQVFAELAELDADYTDTIQGLLTVKAFNAAARWRDRVARQVAAVERSVMRELHVTLAFIGVTQLAMLGGTLGAIAVSAWMLAQGELGIAGALIVLFVMREIYRPIQEVGALAHDAIGGAQASAAVEELLSRAEAVRPSGGRTPVTPSPAPGITFDDVALRYHGRDDDALRGVSFTVGPGETVAIVGPSGAGKSTIASLLMRFVEPDRGRILVDGAPIDGIAIDQARALTALVAQDTYLFHGTVGDNIALARPDASDAEIREAARRAGVETMLDALPRGLDTEVGERGTQLSGGQRQRIAIARALLKDAPVLILDEATSSVDTASEAQIQRALDEAIRGRTTLVIAHRLSTIRGADRILVLEDGRIVQSGTHPELSRREGLYQKLLRSQEPGLATVTGTEQDR